MVKRWRVASVLTLAAVILSACNSEGTVTSETEEIPVQELKELVRAYGDREITSNVASITGEELYIVNEKEERNIGLPKDEFFVSIAPYEKETHDCRMHSLTTCQGELVEEEFIVKVTDDSGKEVMNETRNSGVNGFVDLWLPRDENLEITIQKGEASVTANIETFNDSLTCITTMQLPAV